MVNVTLSHVVYKDTFTILSRDVGCNDSHPPSPSSFRPPHHKPKTFLVILNSNQVFNEENNKTSNNKSSLNLRLTRFISCPSKGKFRYLL